MKPLVFALDAQSWVNAEDENDGEDIMAYVSIPLFVETYLCDEIYTVTDDFVTN